jgi:hypothetical protein
MNIMYKNLKYPVPMFIGIISALISILTLSSCKDFLDPQQDLNVTQDQLFDDWYEYRSAAMGLYGLQQQLVEQLVVLGELRADLLTVTPNADADLIEIYNFHPSKTNKYADPTNFYKLIGASNNLIRVLKAKHPEVLEPESAVNNYDRLYGEALCMRAWAYFNAVRIYGKVPVIHESLTSVNEIESYVNSGGTYKDTSVVYARNGFNSVKRDTIITLEKQFYNLDQIIQIFSIQLEREVKAVGVNHYMDNNDKSWEVTIWNPFAMHALLGQMYLTSGNLIKAAEHFNFIAFTTSDNYRYQLAGGSYGFSNDNWKNIFTTIDVKEHIFTLPFNKANLQQNEFQRLFEPFGSNQYMLKPTKDAVHKWETLWRGYNLIINNSKPALTVLDKQRRGIPVGDYFRGLGTSYVYVKNGELLPLGVYAQMIMWKQEKEVRSYTSLMEDVDTVVYKYSINKNPYDKDANFIIYRAGSIQLYLAEVYTWWAFLQSGIVKPFTTNAVNIVNNGSNYNPMASREQLGIRGRVGYTGTYEGIQVGDINYIQDPFTNEVIGYTNLTGNLLAKQLYLEELIMDERARELAFEGERFYDLMRVANRRNDPSFLAKKVSAKYPLGQREAMYSYLMDKSHWYINIFD